MVDVGYEYTSMNSVDRLSVRMWWGLFGMLV